MGFFFLFFNDDMVLGLLVPPMDFNCLSLLCSSFFEDHTHPFFLTGPVDLLSLGGGAS